MELKNANSKILKEIVMVALTYRVSYKNLARIFGTTIEDVKEAFYSLDFQTRALYFLNEETKLEDEINEKYAYTYAKNYFNKRNKIINTLRNETDKAQIEKLKLELQELCSLVDDSIVLSSNGKYVNQLNDREIESIAKFRLKYWMSLTSAKKVLNRDKSTIYRIEEMYAENNKIFEEKLSGLNNYFESREKFFSYNQEKNTKIGRR